MSWESSARRKRLPRDWKKRRAFVAARANGQCEAMLHDGSRCPASGSECDHIERGDDHRAANLQWLCSWHHKRKTQSEARAALESVRRRRQPKTAPHPGLIDTPTGDPAPRLPQEARKGLSKK